MIFEIYSLKFFIEIILAYAWAYAKSGTPYAYAYARGLRHIELTVWHCMRLKKQTKNNEKPAFALFS